MDQILDKNFKRFQSKHSVRVTKKLPLSPPLSKDKELTDIGHSMSIANLILGINSVTVSYLIHYHNLLQKATDIIKKCDSYFIKKCDRSLLQNASGFFLQNAAVLSQNATVITKCDDFITKSNSYYKKRHYYKL